MADNFLWPVPTSAPDEGTFHTCAFNTEWLPVLVSCLQLMRDPKLWDSPPDDLLDQIATLEDLILTNLD